MCARGEKKEGWILLVSVSENVQEIQDYWDQEVGGQEVELFSKTVVDFDGATFYYVTIPLPDVTEKMMLNSKNRRYNSFV